MAQPPDRDELIGRLPLPLARLCRQAANARAGGPADADPLFWNGYYLWEATVKLLAAVALAEYLRGPKSAAAAEALKSLERPSLGHWVGYLELLWKGRAGTGGPVGWTADFLFAPRGGLPRSAALDSALRAVLATADRARFPAGAAGGPVTVYDLFNRLLQFRNKEIGHGAAALLPPEFREAFGAALLDALAELLAGLPALRAGRLVYLSAVRSRGGGRYAVAAFDLTGEIVRRVDDAEVELTADVPAEGQVYWEWLAGGAARSAPPAPAALRSLHPLVLFQPNAREVWLLNTDAGKRTATYLSYGAVGAPPADCAADRRAFLAAAVGGPVPADAGAVLTPEPAEAAPAAVCRRPEAAQALALVRAALDPAVRAASGLTADAVQAAYDAAVPPDRDRIDPPDDPAAAVAACCDDLAQTALTGGVSSPLLTFVRLLVPHLPAAHAGAVADAAREAALLLGETAPAAPPAAAPPAPARPNSLVIAVWHSAQGPDRYLVKVWFGKPLESEDAVCSAADLPAVIARVYRKAVAGPSRRAAWVEIFLPRDLIAEAVEHAAVSIGPIRSKVGAENPVLVRPADRYYAVPEEPEEREVWRESVAALRERWAKGAPAFRLTDTLPPPGDAGFVYRVPPPASGEGLYFDLREDRAVFGAVLGRPPDPPADGNVFDTLLFLGVPLVAWARRPAAADELARLFHDAPPGDLPARVLRLRTDAARCADADHPGHHVAVLWDDPARPPWDTGAAAEFTTPE